MSKVHFCVEGEELDDQGQRTGRRLPQQQQQQPRAKRWRRLKELGTAAHEFYPEGKAVMLRAYVEAGEYEDGVGPPKAKIDLVTGREGRVFGRLRMNAFEFAQFVEFFQSDAASEVAKALR